MDKQKLIQERENFIELINGLNRRVRKEEMKRNEADFIIKIITKGSTAKAYLYELNKKINSAQDKQPSFKYKKQIILSAAIVIIFSMLFYSLMQPSLTGFVAFEQNKEYILSVEQNYVVGTTEYYFNIIADSNNTNNLTSLRIIGTYTGQFVMKLTSETEGRTAEYVIYESRTSKDSGNMITGYAVRKEKETISINDTITNINGTSSELNITGPETNESNQTITDINNTIDINETTINETVNQTINETITNITESFIAITDKCKDTCNIDISPYNLSIIIEVTEGEFYLENIIYTQKIINQPPIQIKDVEDVYGVTDIDLSEYFYDPEGKDLDYDFMSDAELDYSLNNNILTIMPISSYPQEFYIYVTDGEGVTVSNTFIVYYNASNLTYAFADENYVRYKEDAVLRGLEEPKIIGKQGKNLSVVATRKSIVSYIDEYTDELDLGTLKKRIRYEIPVNARNGSDIIPLAVARMPKIMSIEFSNDEKLDAVIGGEDSFEPKLFMGKWGREAKLNINLDENAPISYDTYNNTINLTYDDYRIDVRTIAVDGVEGGIEFDVVLDSLPSTNTFDFNIDSENLNFYYQPPLDVEFGNSSCNATDCEGHHRPENVVGSYAVYHSSKKNNEYQTGKAFHIYRPLVIDAVNNTIWADMNIDSSSGIMSLIVPQEFLDDAVYPVTIDPPIIGYSNAGVSTVRLAVTDGFGSSNNYRSGNDYSGVNGTLDSINAYMEADMEYSVKGFVNLKDDPGADQHSMVDSGEITNVDHHLDWRTITLTGSQIYSTSTYVLNLMGSGSSMDGWGLSAQIRLYYDSNSANVYGDESTKLDYDNPEDPWNFVPVEDNFQFSIYAIYSTTPIPPNITNFNGTTTNFSGYTAVQLSNLTNVTLDMASYGRIKWKNGINVSGANFDANVKMGAGWIYVNSSGLHSSINSSANLTIYNAPYPNLVILKDGVPCTTCALLSHSGNNYTFNVTSFSNYSLTMNVTLINPVNGNSSVISSVFFVSNMTDINGIVNATLYTNESGTFAARETRWNGEISRNDTSLRALYHFNNESVFGENDTKIRDWSGNGINLSCPDTCPPYASGKFGLGQYKQPTTNDFSAPDSDYFTNWTALTVMAWVNPLRNQSDQGGESGNIVIKRNDGSISGIYNAFYLTIGNDNELVFHVVNSTGDGAPYALGSANSTLAGRWTMILGRYNGTHADVFVNGVKNNTDAYDISGPLLNGDQEFAIGFNDFNGSIDEVAVWNISLSDVEILALYNYSRTKFYPIFQNRSLRPGNYTWNVLAVDNATNYAWSASNFTFIVIPQILSSRIAPTTARTNDTLLGYCNATAYNSSANFTYNYRWFLNGALNMSGTYYSYYCYQESANVSTACGGLNTGRYSTSGTWTNVGYTYDGNWSTTASAGGISANFYVNYTKPANANNGSRWQVMAWTSATNYSIPQACWNQAPLMLRYTYVSTPTQTLYCYNGTAWYNITNASANNRFYEEAMYWNVSILPGLEVNVANISSSLLAKGQNWTLECTANDSIYLSSPLNSSVLTISGFVPNVTSISINSSDGTNYSNENLNVSFNQADIDGDAVYNNTDWRQNGTSIATVNMPFNYNYSYVKDYTTYGNNGTKYGSPVFVGGKVGGAYRFNTTNYINISGSTNITNNFTLAFWINTSGNDGCIISQGGSTMYQLHLINNKIRLRVINGTGIYEKNSTKILQNNSWYHIAISRTNSYYIFINGTFDTSLSNAPSASIAGDIILGGCNASGVNASIDDLIISPTFYWTAMYSYYYTSPTLHRTLNQGDTRRADVWKACVTVADSDGESSGCSNNLTILNTAPVMAVSTITPSTAYTNDTLEGQCFGVDSTDGDTLRYYYKWFLNGVLNNSGVTSLYSPGGESVSVNNLTATLERGQNWTFECTANDNELNSSPMNSSVKQILQQLTVTLQNPSNSNITLTSPVLFVSDAADEYYVVNMTLYTNESGTFSPVETRWNGEVPYNSTGLVALWHFNNESAFGESSSLAYDFSGRGYNATCASASCPTHNVSGMFAGARYFNGSQNFSFPTAGLPYSANARTICLWTKPASVSAGWHWAIWYGTGASAQAFGMGRNADTLYGTSFGDDISVSSFFVAETWYHLCLKYNGTYATLYSNGVNVTAPTAKTWSTTQGSANIGKYGVAATEYWNGLIDEIAIWNRSLSDAEILAVYNYTKDRFYPTFQRRSYSSYSNITWNVLAVNNQSLSLFATSNYSFKIFGNTAPAMYTSTILPTTAYVNTTLIGYCNATDFDLNNVSYFYRWFINGTINFTGNTSPQSQGLEVNVANISSSYLVKGQNWTLECTANDGSVNSSALNSTSLIISNSIPIVSNVVLNTTSIWNSSSDNITVYFTATDVNGDSIYNVTDWRRNGKSIAVLNMPFNTNVSTTASGAVLDYSIYGNNGTLGNGTAGNAPVWNSSGKIGGKYSFDGIDDYILVPDSPGLPGYSGASLTGYAMTIEFWIWINENHGGAATERILTKRHPGDTTQQSWQIGFGSASGIANRLFCGVYNGTGASSGYFQLAVNTTNNITPNTWNHFVCIFNTTTGLDVYLNGIKAAETNISGIGRSIKNSNYPISIGAAFNVSAPTVPLTPLNGSMDDLKMYNHSLSPEQIYAIYQAGINNHSVNIIVQNETSVGENWSACIVSSDTINDSVEVCSNNVTIQLLIPEKVTLKSPTNMNYTVHNRTTLFEWYATNYTTYYTINITSNNCPGIIENITAPQTNYTPTSELCLRSDGYDTYYNWTVKACGTNGCGEWSDVWNFSIEPFVDLTLTINSIDFGSMSLGEEKDTSSGTPPPFIIRNDGNVVADMVNISVEQSMWQSVGLGTEYFQAKANISETGSFNTTGSLMEWFNLTSNNNSIIRQLNYSDSNDAAAIDIRIKVPETEPPGSKNATIFFTWVQTP